MVSRSMSCQDLSFGGTFSGLSSPLDWSLAPAPALPSAGFQSSQNAACASRFAASTAGSMQDKGCPPPVMVPHPFTGNISSAAHAAAAAMGDGNTGLLYGTRRHQQQHLEQSAQANLTYQAQQHQQQLLLCQQQQAVAAANAQQQLLLARLQHQQQQQQAACMSGSSRLGGHMQHLGGQPSPGTQQQQAAMAARAAAAAAAAAAPAPAGGVLYGNYRSNASLQPGGINASASSRLYPHQLPIQHQQQQQHHQRLSGASSLQPAAAGGRVSYHHQQQQQHSGAGSSQRSSHLAWHAAGNSSSSGGGAVAGGGRWSGPVALMELPSAGPSQQSDGSSGSDPALECDEELQSVEVAGSQQQLLLLQRQHYQQQQQQRAGSRPGSRPGSGSRLWQLPQAVQSDQMFLDESGSTKADSENGDDDDLFNVDAMDQDQQQQQQLAGTPTAAAARAVAAAQASAARQSVVLQVLGRTAATRKGGRVLTAVPAAAEQAGAASVRPRLLVTEVSVYVDGAASSRLALEQANQLMSRMTLPDNVAYMPISADSFLFKAASAWQFPAFVIALGSSYLQRMMEHLPQLADAALACPGFEDYCAFLTNKPDVLPPRFCEADAVATLSMLRSVQFTCVFLATKVADQVHALGLLRFILSHMSVNQQVVSMETAADVEARCLETLGWRLGPFFLEDELGGNDEALWAAAMGHWDYGSDADLAAC